MASWWDDNAPPGGNRFTPGSPVNQPFASGGAMEGGPGTPGMSIEGYTGARLNPPPMADYSTPGQLNYAPGTATSTLIGQTQGPQGTPLAQGTGTFGNAAPATTTSGTGSVDPNNPLFQGINPQLVQYFISHGITPTGPGTGPSDIAYLNEKMTEPGQDIGYWLNEKLPNQVFKGGGGGAGGFGSSTAPNPYQAPDFTAPTGLDYMNDPGFKARMQMGTDAIQNAAAARGTLLSGGTLKALERYGQDYGSNEFSNVYNRALGTAGFNANIGQQGYQNRYGQFTDYLGQLNQAANRGLTASNAQYQVPPAG